MAKAVQWHVGDVVRKLREDRGWSMTELARRAGIGRQAVGKVETNNGGQRRGNLERVAKALGFSEPEIYAMVPRRTVMQAPDALSDSGGRDLSSSGPPPTSDPRARAGEGQRADKKRRHAAR